MALTVLSAKNASPGRHSDGKGLYLLVKPSGARSWVLRVQVDGRRRDYGLGSYDVLSLAEARERAAEGRKMAKAGLDPSIEWRRGREAKPTFEQAARQCFEQLRRGWKNGKHQAQWMSTLETYAFPRLGNKRVDYIEGDQVLAVLSPIWLEIPETARRVRQRICSVLDYAFAQNWRDTEFAVRSLNAGLPRQPAKRGHFPAMPYTDVPAFVARLTEQPDTSGRLGLLFTIYTAIRSGGTRGAVWGEIDRENANWTVPGERMKIGEPHTIPLSPQAMAVLDSAGGLLAPRDDEIIFPGNGGKPMSDATMAKALREAGGGDYTVHGFRSSFRDWAAEIARVPDKVGDWSGQLVRVNGDVAEAALAHTLKNKSEAAYKRTKYLEQRRDLMAAWGDFVVGSASSVFRLVANG